MLPLTKRQAEVYRYILKHCQKHGAGPSLRDIGKRFGIGSPNGVVSNIKALTRKGWIVAGGKGQARMVRPVCGYSVQAVKGKA